MTKRYTPTSAAVEAALRLLEGRWKLVILFHLFGGKVMRFSDLERAIPAITQKMLGQQGWTRSMTRINGRSFVEVSISSPRRRRVPCDRVDACADETVAQQAAPLQRNGRERASAGLFAAESLHGVDGGGAACGNEAG
jgi:hypothetical protein